jgi:hypothetical protein
VIVKGGARSAGGFFAKHLMKAEDNERVSITEMKGLYAEDLPEAFRELKALAAGSRGKDYFYHASLNPREDERLTPEQWDFAVDRLEQNLGLDGHARFQVEHEKEGRTHRHIVWSRVDPETMTLANNWRNYEAHDKTRTELEQAFFHEPTPPTPDDPSKRRSREIADWENFRAAETGIDPKEVKAEVTALWQRSDSGAAFVAALEESGYTLCQGDRGYCILDQAGDVHSLTRRIDGVKTAHIRERLADIALAELPTVAEASAAVRARSAQEPTSSRNTDAPEPVTAERLHSLPLPAVRSLEYVPATYPAAQSAQQHADLSEALMRSNHAELPHSRHTWQDWAAHAWETLRDRATDITEKARSFWQDLIKPEHVPPEITHDEPEMER